MGCLTVSLTVDALTVAVTVPVTVGSLTVGVTVSVTVDALTVGVSGGTGHGVAIGVHGTSSASAGGRSGGS